MGEGILRSMAGDYVDAQSAGASPSGYVHPMAIEVMKEIGIDITCHESKNLELFLNQQVNTVITVCGNVNQICPVFPGQIERIHHGFDDPLMRKVQPKKSWRLSGAFVTKLAASSMIM